MRDPITLIRPDAARPESKGVSTALPPDLLDQDRGRVRLLAMLCAVGVGALDVQGSAGRFAANSFSPSVRTP